MRLAWPALASALALTVLVTVAPGVTRAKPSEAAPSCGQRGRVIFDKDSVLTDVTGRKLARFSGGESAVTLIAPPAGSSDLAHIETGTGRGSFRINGYLKASELRTYASYTLPITSGHLWFAAGARVTAAGVSGGKVRIDKQMTTPFAQRFSTVADCSALTFAPPAPPVPMLAGDARVFLMKDAELELFDEMPPTGAPFVTLKRAPSLDNVRFTSNEQRGGYIHIQYQGEVNVDAWAKASDLTALPRGETSDVPPSSYTLSSPPQLALSQTPRIVKTTREIALRLAAREGDAPIGVIEADTEVYVMDVMASWAKVLPKSLHVLPVDELSFWVKAADLGT